MDNEKISHRIKENLYPFHLAQLLFLNHWTQWRELEREKKWLQTYISKFIQNKKHILSKIKNEKQKQISKRILNKNQGRAHEQVSLVNKTKVRSSQRLRPYQLNQAWRHDKRIVMKFGFYVRSILFSSSSSRSPSKWTVYVFNNYKAVDHDRDHLGSQAFPR